MSDYHEKQRAHTEAMQSAGPKYAAAFGKITGKVWTYVDPRRPDDIGSGWDNGFTLRESETGIVISVYGRQHEKRVSASVNWPNMPDGGPHGSRPLLRDFGIMVDGKRVTASPEAGVSLERFLGEIDACARRFVKMVYLPALGYWPAVQAYIEQRRDNFSKRDRVASELAAEFGGRMNGGNGSNNGSVRLYFNDSLPSISVCEGGYIRMDYAPSFTPATLRAYFAAVRAEKSAG